MSQVQETPSSSSGSHSHTIRQPTNEALEDQPEHLEALLDKDFNPTVSRIRQTVAFKHVGFRSILVQQP